MKVMDESALKELHDEPSRRVASVIHYLVFHANYVQLYHELRLSIEDDVGKFSELLSRAQREFIRLKEDNEHKKYIQREAWPSKDDIMAVQRHHARVGKAYLQVLLGMAAGACPRCLEERRGGE